MSTTTITNWRTGEVLYSARNASLREALRAAVTAGVSLRGADLSEADLIGADLRGANLSEANLCGADLSWANLSGANLSGASLSWANLSGANLSEANLRSACLTRASLSGANLRACDLSGCDLREANLREANLRACDLSGCDLSGANLTRANLRGVLGLPTAPVVPDIDARILSAIEAGGELHMGAWHTCETTHCRAGWAVHLAGEAGYALERATTPYLAGRLIYEASRPGVAAPDFFADNEAALADLRACAVEQKGGKL